MKVVILGGSSASTPALFRCLAEADVLPALEIWLVGRSSEHLRVVLRACRTLLGGQTPVVVHSSSFAAEELPAALAGADVVLVQVRFGGHDGRHFDERFPLAYEICGDEGLGPGGLSAAWRGWPQMRRLLGQTASICPKALVLMLSSPLGIFVGAAQREFPTLPIVGLCELPWTTLRELAASREVETRTVEFDYIGLNHLGWFCRIESGARDLLREYLTSSNCDAWWQAELMAAGGGLPTKYLRLHYCPEQVVAEQKQQRISRARALEAIAETCYQVFNCGDKETIVQALSLRPTPWYEHSVVPLLLSLAGAGNRIPFFVTGCVGLQHGCSGMWETPAYIDRGRFHVAASRTSPPDAIIQVLRSFAIYENQAISAVTSQDVVELDQALNLHPWVPTQEIAAGLGRQITSQSATAAA